MKWLEIGIASFALLTWMQISSETFSSANSLVLKNIDHDQFIVRALYTDQDYFEKYREHPSTNEYNHRDNNLHLCPECPECEYQENEVANVSSQEAPKKEPPSPSKKEQQPISQNDMKKSLEKKSSGCKGGSCPGAVSKEQPKEDRDEQMKEPKKKIQYNPYEKPEQLG